MWVLNLFSNDLHWAVATAMLSYDVSMAEAQHPSWDATLVQSCTKRPHTFFLLMSLLGDRQTVGSG